MKDIASVWDRHKHTEDCWRMCTWCGNNWHLATSQRPGPPRANWLCPNCAPPEPHCQTCTCYEAKP